MLDQGLDEWNKKSRRNKNTIHILNQEMNHVIHQREKNKNRFRKKVE
jgi:hypothetical protein